MVATLLRLRWRILYHQFRRDWWRLLFVIAGAIWSLSVVPGLAIGSARLAAESAAVRSDAMLTLGALFALAWIVVPLLATGVDDTLDPARFAPWGIEARRIMPGLAVAAFTTVPAIFFVAVAAVMGSVWRTDSVEVLLTGLAGALLTAASWVFSARLAALWGGRLIVSRSGRAAVIGTVVALFGGIVAGAVAVRRDGLESFIDYELASVLKGLGRTPLGAGFTAPRSLFEGDTVGAVWRLALTAGWAVLLFFAWRSAVAYTLVHPIMRGSGSHRRDDAILNAVSAPDFTGKSRTPRSRMIAAVRQRTLRSWRADPRYLAQLVAALLLPTVGGGMAIVVAGGAGVWITVLPIALALGVGWGRHNDLAYDSSAVWLDIVSGVSGRDLMAGRLLATLQWAGPAVLLACIAAVGSAGRWDVFAPVTATALGVLAAGLGVSSVTAVALPYRVPAPGESPFGADAGSIGASLIGQAVSSLGTGVVVPLVAAPLLAAFMWGGGWWVLSVVVSIVLGVAVAILGVRAAGSLFEARAGKLIAAVS